MAHASNAILLRYPSLRCIPSLVIEGNGYTVKFIGSSLFCPSISTQVVWHDCLEPTEAHPTALNIVLAPVGQAFDGRVCCSQRLSGLGSAVCAILAIAVGCSVQFLLHGN